MRNSLPLVLIAILLAGLAFCSGCMSQPEQNLTSQHNLTPVTDVGLVPVRGMPAAPVVRFDDAVNQLEERESSIPLQNGSLSGIHFILGAGLDDAGNAHQWIFGLSNGSAHELQVMDPAGWTTIPYSGTLPATQVSPATIVSPGQLFLMNKAAITGDLQIGAPEQRSLDLRNGTYTVTIASGSTSRVLMFNATTGDAIEKND
jgi:hypothetical protein